MRAARLLRLADLLQTRGRMTAQALAEALEVAPRTVRRDVEALAEAGFPVSTHPGQDGGIELDRGFRRSLSALTERETLALALLLAAPLPAIGALGLARDRESLRAKLAARLPAAFRAEAAAAAARLAPPVRDGPENPVLAMLATAILGRRVVLEEGGPPIHPLALTEGGGAWTLRDGNGPARDRPVAALGRLTLTRATFGPAG